MERLVEKSTNDVNVKETGESEGHKKLIANSASANHKHLGILKIFQNDIRGGRYENNNEAKNDTEKKRDVLHCMCVCVCVVWVVLP